MKEERAALSPDVDDLVLGDVKTQMNDITRREMLDEQERDQTDRHGTVLPIDDMSALESRGYGGEAAENATSGQDTRSEEEILDDRSEQVDIGRSA